MASYTEKLKDPRWQRKRLEILERADFKCDLCGDRNSTLHVHHRYYERNCDPWEYPDYSFDCLCESCHESITEGRQEVETAMGHIPPAYISTVKCYLDKLRERIEAH